MLASSCGTQDPGASDFLQFSQCADFAILTASARLGLRVGEVAALRLGDIDWRAGELTMHGKAACDHLG